MGSLDDDRSLTDHAFTPIEAPVDLSTDFAGKHSPAFRRFLCAEALCPNNAAMLTAILRASSRLSSFAADNDHCAHFGVIGVTAFRPRLGESSES
jgi:hypothetical protein